MKTDVFLQFRYEAQCAHRLIAGVPENHPCSRPHGHRYVLKIGVVGPVKPDTGMVVEYEEVDRVVREEVLKWIDHHDLNTLPARRAATGVMHGVELDENGEWNPTVENLILFVASQLLESLPGGCSLSGVEIEEDENHSAFIAIDP